MDNNNYLTINKVSMKVSRWNLFHPAVNSQFITENSKAAWVGETYQVNEKVTLNGKQITF
jgi:hypothetical protein